MQGIVLIENPWFKFKKGFRFKYKIYKINPPHSPKKVNKTCDIGSKETRNSYPQHCQESHWYSPESLYAQNKIQEKSEY